MPTEPLHCIYHLGLGVVAQGAKQVVLGGDSLGYNPGQSMLTTIDLPVVSHVTRASVRDPFLGMMLRLDAGGRVGYESPSQFSREYRRLFGAPPQRDVTRMRLVPVTSSAAGYGERSRSTS